MRHVRMLGLCLVAALALGAYASSSAMAGPQWVKCESASELEAVEYPFEAKQVKYTDANCTSTQPKEARAYVLLKAPEVENLRLNYLHKATATVPFTGESLEGGGVLTAVQRICKLPNGEKYIGPRQGCAEREGTETLKSAKPNVVECAAETNTGEAVSKNQVGNVRVLFTECYTFGTIPCYSPGFKKAYEEEEGANIETETLKGKLGYINKAAKEVGLLLEPEQKHGAFAELQCSVIEFVVGVGNKKEGTGYTSLGCSGLYTECPATPEDEKHGGYDGIISPITPVNEMTSEFTQVYSQEPEYPFTNIPSNFEGKHLDALEVTAYARELEQGHTAMWAPAGEQVTNVSHPEEAGEIKA